MSPMVNNKRSQVQDSSTRRGGISQTMSFLSEPSHHSSEHFRNTNSSGCLQRCVATLKGNSSYVSSLTVDGDNSLYVASSDGHIRLWPLDMATDVNENEHSICTVATTDSSIKCLLAISKGVVSAHQDGKIRVWHTGKKRNGTSRLTLRAVLPTAVDCLRTFLLPKNYVEVRRHSKRTWVHHVDAVTALAVSPDGLEMYSVSWDRSLKAWRMDGLRCVESVAAAHDDAINAVAVSPDGRVFTGSADKTIKAWRCHPCQRKKLALVGTMARHEAAVNALALGVDGYVLYSGACDRTVVAWELATGAMAVTATLRGHTKAVLCLAAAGDVVCSGSADRTVRVWMRGATMMAGYTCLAVLEGHAGAVKSLAVVSKMGGDHDGLCKDCCSAFHVCSGSLDCHVKIWRVNVSVCECSVATPGIMNTSMFTSEI